MVRISFLMHPRSRIKTLRASWRTMSSRSVTWNKSWFVDGYFGADRHGAGGFQVKDGKGWAVTIGEARGDGEMAGGT